MRTGRGLGTAGAVLLPCCLCLLLAGCRGRCDLVEAELRTRENDMRELRDELNRVEAHNEALNRELCTIRQGGGGLAPEVIGQTSTVRQIVLGRGTGGYDDDHCPGDEGLQVFLEPRDADGHPIKAPGTLNVTALQIDGSGLKEPLASWDVPPDQLRRAWKSGLLSTGYQVTLPWKKWPDAEKVRVVARFTLADGRVFEADRDVSVRLVPEAQRRPLPALPGPPLEEVIGPLLPGTQARLPVLWKPNAGMPAAAEPVMPVFSPTGSGVGTPVQLLKPAPRSLPRG